MHRHGDWTDGRREARKETGLLVQQEPCPQSTLSRLAERLADCIRETVDAAPPLTAEQRDKLALLLRPSPGPAA